MVADAGDGALLFRAWWDTELEDSCLFTPTSDGAMRCVPSTSSVVAYTDSDCTEPAAIYFETECTTGPEKYHYQPVEFPADSCDESWDHSYRVFETGASMGVTQAYFKGPGTCTMGPSMFELFEVEEVDPAAFVLAQERVEERGALGAVLLEAEDGARQVVGMKDLGRDKACQALELVGLDAPSRPCVGRIANLGKNAPFVNETCTELGTQPTCANPAAIVVIEDDPLCGTQSRALYEVGAAADPPYSPTQDSCIEFPVDGTFVYGLGTKLDNNTLPALTVTLLGSNRLRVRALSAGNDIPISATGFYDGQRSAGCSSTVVLDGDPDTVYCLGPEAADADYSLYTDAGCLEPVVLHDPGDCDLPPPTIGLSKVDLQGCSEDRIAHELAVWEGDFFSGLPGSCQAVERGSVLLPGMSAFELGDEIQLDPELAFTLRTE